MTKSSGSIFSQNEKIPSDSESISNTDEVHVYLREHMPKMEDLGEVKLTKNNICQLSLHGKLVFEAARILNRRSISKDGILAVAALKDRRTPTPKNNLDEETDPTGIWLIVPGVAPKLVTPPNIDASFPLISEDGKYLAFTGCDVNSDGYRGVPSIFVIELSSMKIRKFSSINNHHAYNVTAVGWSNNNTELRIIETHGESSGEMVMKIIHL